MNIRIGRVRLRITFAFALFFAFTCGTAAGEKMTATLVSALFHECVHLVFLIACGCTDICVTLRPGGASLQCAGLEFAGVKTRLAVFLSAPLANLAAGAVLCWLFAGFDGKMRDAGFINLCLGAANLLPVRFLDGGRAFSAVLDEKSDEETQNRLIITAEAASLILLAAFTLALAASGKNPFGAAVFTVYCAVFSLVEKSRKRE